MTNRDEIGKVFLFKFHCDLCNERPCTLTNQNKINYLDETEEDYFIPSACPYVGHLGVIPSWRLIEKKEAKTDDI